MIFSIELDDQRLLDGLQAAATAKEMEPEAYLQHVIESACESYALSFVETKETVLAQLAGEKAETARLAGTLTAEKAETARLNVALTAEKIEVARLQSELDAKVAK